MSDIDTAKLPDTWQAYLPLATALARTLLATAGGVGFTWAQAVTADQVQMGVSAAMILAAGLWSLWQKIQAQRALRQASTNPISAPTPKLPA